MYERLANRRQGRPHRQRFPQRRRRRCQDGGNDGGIATGSGLLLGGGEGACRTDRHLCIVREVFLDCVGGPGIDKTNQAAVIVHAEPGPFHGAARALAALMVQGEEFVAGSGAGKGHLELGLAFRGRSGHWQR